MKIMDTSVLHRDTWVEIHLDRIEHNIKEIKKWLPKNVLFMAAVKADAYGHGDLQVAKIALQAGAEALGVALLSEALHLRRNGIEAPILVLLPVLPSDVNIAIDQDISVTVFQASWLKEMLKHKKRTKPLKVHVKLDTGLGRIGIREEAELEQIIPWLKTGEVQVEGIFTHFATANREDSTYFDQQYARFQSMIQRFQQENLSARYYHCANSATALQFPDKALDIARVGVAMLGIYPSMPLKKKLPFSLKAALSFHSKLSHVKKVEKGSFVGYDNSYEAQEDEWIATVPVGYADGWFRCFQGFHVLVDGQKAPIVGTICMDQMMIRLPREYPRGEKVVLIGQQGQEEITLYELADHIGSVPQEIPSMITYRVPKVYFYHGEAVEILSERIWLNAPLPIAAETELQEQEVYI